jgi:uncharacterized protein (TIGR02996 family)
MTRGRRRSTAEELRAAADALDTGASEPALAAILEAWRATRDPRIADLVDRIAATIARPAIEDDRLPERSRTWLGIARREDPADVGRLIAASWPGTWNEGARWMRALLRFGEDPRIAMELARQIALQRYRTPMASRYYNVLYNALVELGDVRTIPVLEEELARLPPLRVSGAVHVEAATIARIRERPRTALDHAAARELELLESRFVASAREDAARARGHADFLAAIYADPDDMELRQVFADWLQDRGDLRGELIALQLAGERTPAVQRREARLLADHGVAWAGILDRVLRKHDRVWHAGFVVGGVLAFDARRPQLPAGVEDRACATLRELELPYDLRDDALTQRLLDLPWARRLRVLRWVSPRAAMFVLRGAPRPHLRELRVAIAPDDDELRAALRDSDAVPNLEHLRLGFTGDWSELPDLAWLRGRRLHRLTTHVHPDDLATWLARTESLDVTEVAFELSSWRVIATRDTKLRMRIEPIARSAATDELVRVLATLPESLGELAIVKADLADSEQLADALRRFTAVIIEGGRR